MRLVTLAIVTVASMIIPSPCSNAAEELSYGTLAAAKQPERAISGWIWVALKLDVRNHFDHAIVASVSIQARDENHRQVFATRMATRIEALSTYSVTERVQMPRKAWGRTKSWRVTQAKAQKCDSAKVTVSRVSVRRLSDPDRAGDCRLCAEVSLRTSATAPAKVVVYVEGLDSEGFASIVIPVYGDSRVGRVVVAREFVWRSYRQWMRVRSWRVGFVDERY